jgi:hypothetical protein
MSTQLNVQVEADTLSIQAAGPVRPVVDLELTTVTVVSQSPGVTLGTQNGQIVVPTQAVSLLVESAPSLAVQVSPQSFSIEVYASPAPSSPALPGGSTETQYSAVAAVDMPAGTPVYISRSNSRLYPADNSASSSSLVAGLLIADVEAGFIGTYDRLTIALADWTEIIGSAALLTGQIYFLGRAGTLTTTVPSAPGTNTRVGEALDTTRFALFPSIVPILL